MRATWKLVAAIVIGLMPAIGSATEITTFSYDVHGRLLQVSLSGGVNDGVTISYSFDKAHNRLSKAITGAPSLVVVVPLNGLTVIPIN